MNTIPLGNCLIILIGPSGAGKSTFAQKHFEPSEIISSDALRQELLGDFKRLDGDSIVFEEFHHRIRTRLRLGQRAVVDATHLNAKDRRMTAQVGRDFGVPIYYVVINRPLDEKERTAGWRRGVQIDDRSLIQVHDDKFVAALKDIQHGDGDRSITVIDTRTERVDCPQRIHHDGLGDSIFCARFDRIRVVGDVHGNLDGLHAALSDDVHERTFFLFLGDICDYGSGSLAAVSKVADLIRMGRALSLRGNHERKIYRWLQATRSGDPYKGRINGGNTVTVESYLRLNPMEQLAWANDLTTLVEWSPDWINLEGWQPISGESVAYLFVHGAAHPSMYGNSLFRAHRNSAAETFAMYGETDGTERPDGFPNRTYNWIDHIPSRYTVVVGHAVRSTDSPHIEARGLGSRAIFLDTGSSKVVKGQPGHLSWLDLNIEGGLDGPTIRELQFGSHKAV